MNTKTLSGLAIASLLFALMAIGGQGDYEQALASEQDYCERVADGIHTNYENIDCSKYEVVNG